MSFGYNFHDVVYNAVNTTTTVTVAPAPGANRKNYLLGFYLVANAGVIVSFNNAGAGGTAISGPIPLAANVPLVVPFSPVGLGVTNTNTALNMTLNTSVQVSGAITYLPWF